MPATGAAGFALGAILLVAARFVPQLISPLAFWLLLAALAAGFGVELLLWASRGVRAIELDGDTLSLWGGRTRSIQRIERSAVRTVRSRRSWGGNSIELTFPDRGRTMLRDDAFDRDAFAGLADRLAAWGGVMPWHS
jgi:hypothetical protein